jgi:hypothetical protein
MDELTDHEKKELRGLLFRAWKINKNSAKKESDEKKRKKMQESGDFWLNLREKIY